MKILRFVYDSSYTWSILYPFIFVQLYVFFCLFVFMYAQGLPSSYMFECASLAKFLFLQQQVSQYKKNGKITP